MVFKIIQRQMLSGPRKGVGNAHAGTPIVTSRYPAIFAALLVAALMIRVLYPSSFLDGRGAFFESGDAAQHVTGWLFYVRDAWHFPLLHTFLLNHPHGTSIAFTDSIPLAALLVKPFASWLPEQFHYIGWWHAVAYLMQALGAVALIRALGVRHLPGAIAAASMSVMWPTLYWRTSHTSLMTHGLILFALALYFSGSRASHSTARTGLLQIAVSVAALLIHPYLFAMCYPIFIAYLVDQGLNGKGWKTQGGLFVLSLVTVAAVSAALGYFSQGNTVTAGFGQYSLDLAAPFCGGTLTPCPFNRAQLNGESFTYFGAGALTIILVGIAVRARSFISAIRRYPALIVLMALFLLYAISPTVRWGAQVAVPELYRIPASLEVLTGTFRVSARFFWPVAYLIIFGAMAAVFRSYPLLATAVMIVALPLQWIDTSDMRSNVRSLVSAPAGDDLSKWDVLLKGVRSIHLYPAYSCGAASDHDYVFAQRIAARYHKPLDTGHVARLKEDCEANDREFDGALAADALYLLPVRQLESLRLNLPAGFRKAASLGECAETAHFIACRPGTDSAYWSGKQIVTRPISGLPYGSAHWEGAQLPGITGQVSGNHRLANATDAPGFLTFGPYARLAPGAYQFKLVYDSAEASTAEVGWWDLVLMDDNAKSIPVIRDELPGSAGMEKEISGNFNVEGTAHKVEIRTYSNGGHALRVHRLTITRQSPNSPNIRINE
ncbi:DUF6311 domain-containing protein [Noviherbaspirillum sp. CPCC 100848]|uniref:DUF6311 domain-containing protein n=1 Tax=Noviherbaspirillum album TaxID=3080276 RepID=A0ABU6J511_9BURK|nr:DUF6311 domain-containing protein [Noviherbaspirillum sp. CPCC 100848]MEC4718706.1 DUF6311 domain-containing protein [Noviherbaspirillum sp. CPCC 100848]